MSFLNEVSMNEIRAAKESLKTGILKDFLAVTGEDRLVNGIGIGRISAVENCIQVNLLREPTDVEKQSFPAEHMGIKIRYQLTSKPQALTP